MTLPPLKVGRYAMNENARTKSKIGPDERRERRRLRREKQRAANIGRAEKMHLARLAATFHVRQNTALAGSAFVGCSGWFYWKWRGSFYPVELPTSEWFGHYAARFDTVEINASFYSWPTVANVKSWLRQSGAQTFIYTVKVCELITHIQKFEDTRALVKDFGLIADILGERMGCFLFQLPPSYHFTEARLSAILAQLDPERRNVVEFRHASWWNDTVFAAFQRPGHDILLVQRASSSGRPGSHSRRCLPAAARSKALVPT